MAYGYVFDMKGQKVPINELDWITGPCFRNIVNNEKLHNFKEAVELEFRLLRHGYEFPAELFMKRMDRFHLNWYLDRLTDGLFSIRQFNPMTGEINNYNLLKATWGKKYDNIKHFLLRQIRVHRLMEEQGDISKLF